jgi:hypothetical protein
MGSDADLAKRLDGMKRDDFAFHAEHPAERVLPQIRKRANVGNLRRVWAWAAAAAVLAVIVPLGLMQTPDAIRTKGTSSVPALLVYSSSAPESALKSGSVASAGDTVQLAYTPGRNRYGVIVSIDGRGGVTLHQPETADDASRLAPGERTVLPTAYRLDDAPRFELFIFVASRSPVGSEAVLRKIRTLSGLSAGDAASAVPGLFPSCDTTVFVLNKE